MIDQKLIAKPKPVLKAADLGGANVAIVTVTHAEQVTIKGDTKVFMTFAEFPEHTYYPNLTCIRRAVDAYGLDEAKWVGKPMVLEVVKVNDPSKNRQVPALWIAEPETWDAHTKAAQKRVERAEREAEREKENGKGRKKTGRKSSGK